jgi:hypothetical protein
MKSSSVTQCSYYRRAKGKGTLLIPRLPGPLRSHHAGTNVSLLEPCHERCVLSRLQPWIRGRSPSCSGVFVGTRHHRCPGRGMHKPTPRSESSRITLASSGRLLPSPLRPEQRTRPTSGTSTNASELRVKNRITIAISGEGHKNKKDCSDSIDLVRESSSA